MVVAYCMFKRPHHQAIESLLSKLDADLFRRAQCYFAGGTAIVLAAGEYRESVDIDFLCSSEEGYRLLRECVNDQGFAGLTRQPVTLVREVKKDRDGIRTIVRADDTANPIKLEIVREARIGLTGDPAPGVAGIPTLSRSDMYAEKLLANADRWGDHSVMSRDAIDLAMMVQAWGDIPTEALQKAQQAYGTEILSCLVKASSLLRENTAYLADALRTMAMEPSLLQRIPAVLAGQLVQLGVEIPPSVIPALYVDTQITRALAERQMVEQHLDTDAGFYHGEILCVCADKAIQDTGRHVAVIHTIPTWKVNVRPGQQYMVGYRHGIPEWQPCPPLTPRAD